MVTLRVNKCLIVIHKPLTIATKYKRSKNVISLLETIFLRPDKDIVSIEVIFYFLFFFEANPAIRFIFCVFVTPSAVEGLSCKTQKDAAAIRARAFRTYCSIS
jgi:hypothetical protein